MAVQMKTGLRILIADDHASMRGLLRKLCAPLASELFEVEDGADAVRCFETHHPELLVTDIEMPVMNGLDAGRAIRASHPMTRIIVITQYDTPDFRDAALEIGADFLPKENLYLLPELLTAHSYPHISP